MVTRKINTHYGKQAETAKIRNGGNMEIQSDYYLKKLISNSIISKSYRTKDILVDLSDSSD